MTTIYDIAKKTGYSIATVSKVLNNYPNVSEKAKQTVLAAVEEFDYLPNSSARTLATNKSWMIGVVFAEHLGIGMAHPFFSSVIENFKKHVESYNYDLLFVSRNIDVRSKLHDHLIHRGVDGVVIVQSTNEEALNFIKADIPTVFIDINLEGTNVVYSDNVRGSMIAIDYLYGLGHRKIAHISGDLSRFVAMERNRGFQQAVEKYQLQIPENYIVAGGYYSYEGGRKAMQQLLKLTDRPTAVYASGDSMAMGAISAIKEAGLRIPEDISIVGFDDIPMAKYLDPPLTTIRQDKEQLGTQAANVLLDEINGVRSEHSPTEVPVKLVERASCKAVDVE